VEGRGSRRSKVDGCMMDWKMGERGGKRGLG
jgi:hypothetical protein